MYSVQEIWEEQERQYNQLMQEDDQYCHPESFKWGFEHGFEYALSKLGWHPASEDEPQPYETVVVYCETSSGITSAKEACVNENHCWTEPNVQWWCYLPGKEDKK